VSSRRASRKKHMAKNKRAAVTKQHSVSSDQSGRWTEAQLAEWLVEQILAYDAGTLLPEQVAEISEVLPSWLSDDTRFHYGLLMDWTQERLATFLGAKLALYDAGEMSPAEVAEMDRTMPDWLTDAARIFCGQLPPGW
jgi:hypothetical protein